MRIEALLFDKDGTLFDFNKSWGAWAEDFLTQVAQDRLHFAALAKKIGYLPEKKCFDPTSEVIAGTPDEVTDLLEPLLPHLSRHEIIARVNQAAQAAQMVPAVPLIPLFARFRAAGYKLGLVTNDSEGAALSHMDEAGLRDYFDFIIGYDSGFGAKPAPDGLLAFAKKMDIAPAHIAMVGDSLHDLEAARAAGMWRIGVLSGVATRADLTPFADVVLDDIGQIPDWIS